MSRKRYYRKPKQRKRWFRPYVKATAPAVAYIATRAARQLVKQYVNTEVNYSDSADSLTPDDSTGSVSNLQSIAQGDGQGERVGDQIKIKGIQLKAKLIINGAATATSVFLAIVQDMEQDGSVPNTPVWATGSNSPFTGTNVLKIKSRVTGRRFRIVWQRTIHLDPNDHNVIFVQKFIKLNHRVRFVGTGSTVASMGRGSFWLMAISDENTNTPTFVYQARTSYLDN